MHWFMVVLMLLVVLVIYTMTHGWRMIPHVVPLISLDWLGCFLWSAAMLEVIWLFTYGEYYNWWDSPVWINVLLALPVTLLMCIGRMTHIRHPYIDPMVFPHWRIIPILGMFFVAEVMNATPHALQNALTGGVLHWGYTTTNQLYVFEFLGYIGGAAFTIFWHRPLHQKYTRLLTLGFFCLLMYQVIMYFQISPVVTIERLWFPTFLRTFGYAIFFATMTLYLKDLIEFPTFFHALTVSGFIRNGVAESMCSGVYNYGMRHQIADTLSRGLHADFTSVLLVSIKEMYGIMCIVGAAVLLMMMAYDVQPVRSTMQRMPKLKKLVKIIYRQSLVPRRSVQSAG